MALTGPATVMLPEKEATDELDETTTLLRTSAASLRAAKIIRSAVRSKRGGRSASLGCSSVVALRSTCTPQIIDEQRIDSGGLTPAAGAYLNLDRSIGYEMELVHQDLVRGHVIGGRHQVIGHGASVDGVDPGEGVVQIGQAAEKRIARRLPTLRWSYAHHVGAQCQPATGADGARCQDVGRVVVVAVGEGRAAGWKAAGVGWRSREGAAG